MSAPADAGKLPEGVDRTARATVRSALALPPLLRSTPTVDETKQNIEKFLATPLAEVLPGGFTAHAATPDSVFRNKGCNILGLSLMTTKKKPMAAAFVYDDTNAHDGYLVILMRGDRNKQSEHKLFEVDNITNDVLTTMVYILNPKEPCNFHPWFSSILLSCTSECAENGKLERAFVTPVKALSANVSASVSRAITNNRVLIAVCVPAVQSVEKVLHKLAIDKAGPCATASVVAEHTAAWTAMADKAGLKASQVYTKFKEVSLGVQNFVDMYKDPMFVPAAKAPAPAAAKAPVAASSAGSKRSVVIDEEDDGLESAPKKARAEKESEREKRGGRYKRPGQFKLKFIEHGIEGSVREDEHEESETRQFEKKLNKMQDTDEDSSESGSESESGKKKKKKKHVSDSESEEEDESELSDSHESDEESSEEESSDEASEDSEDEASATSSGEDEKPKKRGRLVKAADLQERNGSKLTKTTLNTNSTECSLSATASEPKRKQVSRPPPAKGNRSGVAAQCNLMLDSVEACTGIPLSLMEKVNSLVAELRDGFADYESDKFPIKKTYALHTATFNLSMTLINIINANLTPDQKNGDASASRRLAVSVTSALLDIVPSLDQVDVQMRKSIKAIETLQRMTTEIAGDFKASAANINIDSE